VALDEKILNDPTGLKNWKGRDYHCRSEATLNIEAKAMAR
jgi:hypothetical protein